MGRVVNWKPFDLKNSFEELKCEDDECNCEEKATMSTISPSASTVNSESTPLDDANTGAKRVLNYLGETQAALQAVAGEAKTEPTWEPVEVIMDSGAHVSVGPPTLGRQAGYKVEASPGSRAGICYTAANGGELPNLGQRFMAVVTEEGTLRGMEQQVADVTKPLESVRANVRAGHAVIFDDDGTGRGMGSYLINKSTGEVNAIRDDGKDYIMRRWIVPPGMVHNVMNEQGFQRRGS